MLPLRGTSTVPGLKRTSDTPTGGHVPGHRIDTEPLVVSCMTKVQQACLQRDVLRQHFARPCHLHQVGHYLGMASAKELF